MQFTISHTTSLLCVSYLDDLSQIVTNIREIILQTTRVFFRRAWWKEVGPNTIFVFLSYTVYLCETHIGMHTLTKPDIQGSFVPT